MADCPWSYSDKMKGHSFSLDHEYITQPLKWIKNLPVASIATKDSALLLWVPSPMLNDGLDVMKAWGWKYVTVAFVWSKHTRHGKKIHNLGRWTMGNTEMCLLGRRGKIQRQVLNIKQLVEAERREHSRKPDEVRQRAEVLFGDVRRMELFARGSYEHWDQFGNEP